MAANVLTIRLLCDQQAVNAAMFRRIARLLRPVRVKNPDPTFGRMLLAHFGAADLTTAAAIQYSLHAMCCEHPPTKRLLEDVAAEEWNHLELVIAVAAAHLKADSSVAGETLGGRITGLASSAGMSLANSPRSQEADGCDCASRLANVLRCSIAAERKAITEHERLLDLCGDGGTKRVIRFLLTRKHVHVAAFARAIDDLQAWRPNLARTQPDQETDSGVWLREATRWELSSFYR